MYRIIQDNKVVSLCDRFRWVRMMDGVLVGTIKATAQGFEARVPVLDGDNYVFSKQVYALADGGLTGTEPVASIVEFHGAVDLWDTAENNPDNAPTLWEDLPYIDGIRIIPEVITVGTAFSKGEQGWWNGALYESQADNNVWTPDAYPAYWTDVTK